MTRVLVPYRVGEPKTRLAPVLDARERRELSRRMLKDVLSAVREAGYDPTVLSTASLSEENCIVDDRPLTDAVNAQLQPGTERRSAPQEAGRSPATERSDAPRAAERSSATERDEVPQATGRRPATAIVMADLALATPTAVARLLETPGDVVFAPGRGGGTNAVFARHSDFRVDYHGASYNDHLTRCETIGASTRTVDSYRLGTDIDEPADLPELLVHGTGSAADWLGDRFTLCTDDTGRVGVERA